MSEEQALTTKPQNPSYHKSWLLNIEGSLGVQYPSKPLGVLSHQLPRGLWPAHEFRVAARNHESTLPARVLLLVHGSSPEAEGGPPKHGGPLWGSPGHVFLRFDDFEFYHYSLHEQALENCFQFFSKITRWNSLGTRSPHPPAQPLSNGATLAGIPC